MYDSAEIAKRIKCIAKTKQVSISAMLADSDLGKNSLSHMNHGKAIASDSLAKIADYLDCSVDYLLGRTSDPESHK